MVFSIQCRRLVAAAVLAVAAPWVVADTSGATLAAAVDAAWQRSVQGRTLGARHHEIAANRDAARSWIAGSPTVGLTERSDRWTNERGMREAEISLAAPLWLPGQQAARRTLAEAGAENHAAQIAQAKLAIAGEVRERLWAVVAAREALAESLDHAEHLEQIAADVARRVKAGELARTDGMLAQQEVLAARAAVGAARSKVQEAVTRYTLITGMPDIPTPVFEADAGGKPDIDPQHPRLAAARAAVQRAQAALGVADAVRSEPPTVGVSLRRERDNFGAGSNQSVGLSLQIPIGTPARNRPLQAAALTQLETANASLAQAEFALQAEIELARQQLDDTRQALDSATARSALTREHLQWIEKAFRAGEKGLAEVLRARFLAHEAEAAERQQRAALGAAHARLNQARGVLP